MKIRQRKRLGMPQTYDQIRRAKAARALSALEAGRALDRLKVDLGLIVFAEKLRIATKAFEAFTQAMRQFHTVANEKSP